MLSPGAWTPFFCEENVYMLLKSAAELDDSYALAISNEHRMVFLDQQNADASERTWVVWDYHVLAMSKKQVFDYASRLPFGVEAEAYVEATWPKELCEKLDPHFVPLFRLIRARDYVRNFASDREHMRDSGRDFPPYPPIVNTTGETDTLWTRILADMREGAPDTESYGQLMTLDELRRFASGV